MGKTAIQSKTIQGQTALLAAFAYSIIHGSTAGFDFSSVFTAAIGVVGYAWGVYGRYKAGEPISGLFVSVVDDLKQPVDGVIEDEKSN